MRKRLSELEQLVMEYVWAHPASTVDACREGLAGLAGLRPLKESTVRTLLQRLEKKGYVTHTVEGRAFLYRASERQHDVAAQAVKQIVDRLCGGSVEQLLVGMVENRFVDRQELAQLARKIARKKSEVK
jgi:predicted transcriptional regulator